MSLGLDGVNARIAQLQSRLDALAPKPSGGGDFQAYLSPPTGELPMDPDGLGAKLSPLKGAIGPMVAEAAGRHDVSPELFAAVVHQESGGDPSAVSRAGAQGLCQLMPETAKELGVTDPFDAAQNLDGGARYLKRMLDANGGDPARALASYNWGLGNVRSHGPGAWPAETRHYVTNILSRMRDS